MALIEGDLPIDRDVTNIYVTITFFTLVNFFQFKKKTFQKLHYLKNGPQNYSYIDDSNYSYIDDSTPPTNVPNPPQFVSFLIIGHCSMIKNGPN